MGELVQVVHRNLTLEGYRKHMTEQETTQRVKDVEFDSVSPAEEFIARGVEMWERSHKFQQPLIQFRGILRLDEEDKLLDHTDRLNDEAQPENAQAWVAGRIPFRANGQELGIYYLQMASKDRPVYRNGNWLTHEQAVAQAIQKKQTRIDKPLAPGFSVKVLEWTNGQARDILTGHEEHYDMEEMAARLAAVHKLAFAYPHDPAQQTPEGVYEILKQNPVAVALNPRNEVASVGLFEQDVRFTYGGIKLIEPTYYTHPGEEYRSHGLSSHLRMATGYLAQHTDEILSWGGNPVIPFNESVRNTSFMLAQQYCEIAGNANGRISGNLGDAYTAIGPANPDIGYMPMGLTYYPLHQSIRI